MSFSAVIGQDRPISILKAYIKSSSLEGGYLFTGAAGIGKKMTALALAEELVGRARHPDVHLISDDEPQIKIDVIRRLQKEISLKAYEGEYKVFIIDNAHTLTAEASNALLKILEEPPQKTLIILITDKPNLIFKTVASRCKALKFAPLARNALEEVLRKQYGLDAALAHFLAYYSDGSIGLALRLKEENVIGKRNNAIDKIALAASPGAEGLVPVNRLEARGALNLLATWFRDIYLLKTGIAEGEVINGDRKQDLARAAGRLSFGDLDKALGSITMAITCLDKNVNLRLLMLNLRLELWKD